MGSQICANLVYSSKSGLTFYCTPNLVWIITCTMYIFLTGWSQICQPRPLISLAKKHSVWAVNFYPGGAARADDSPARAPMAHICLLHHTDIFSNIFTNMLEDVQRHIQNPYGYMIITIPFLAIYVYLELKGLSSENKEGSKVISIKRTLFRIKPLIFYFKF